VGLAGAEGFNAFWSIYPRKDAKKKAFAAWLKVAPGAELFNTIISAVKRQSQTEQWKRGVIPHATTWLNGERWNDKGVASDWSDGREAALLDWIARNGLNDTSNGHIQN